MRPSWTNVAAGVLLLALGYNAGHEPGETVVINHVVPYAAYRDSLKAARLESKGLRAKLAGRERLEPRTILRTDTSVSPPDTVVQLVTWREGVLSLSPLIKRDSLYAPEIHRYQIGNCDDGWSWTAGELVCDKARLGHLSLAISAGATYPIGIAATGGVEWIPSNNSRWRAFLGTDQRGLLTLSVARGWRIF